MPLVHRRSFLIGLGSLLADPAIVHASNLMPIKAIIEDPGFLYNYAHQQIGLGYAITRKAIKEIMAANLLNYSTEYEKWKTACQ